MAIWLNRKSLDDTKSLRNYLLRAVHNNSLRLIKAEEIRRAREEKAMEEQMMDWEEEAVTPDYWQPPILPNNKVRDWFFYPLFFSLVQRCLMKWHKTLEVRQTLFS